MLVLILYFLLFCSAPTSSEGASISARIANGFRAKEGRFPFIVALLYAENDSFFCGGTIIAPKFIVTAAHCFTAKKPINIVAGTTIFRNFEYKRRIVNVIIHPKYDDIVRYDVAVAELDDELPMIPRKVMYARLPEYSTEIPDEYGSVVGWGVSKHGDTIPSPFLMAACLKKMKCITWYEFFCLGNPEGEEDTCSGDSGGPFLINRTLYGIVSHGISPCATGTLGRYVKVPYVVEWIREMIS